MIDHVGISVRDYDRSRAFYEAVLAPIGAGLVMEISAAVTGNGTRHAGFGRDGKPTFWIGDRADAKFTHDGLHLAFVADSRAAVDAFHAAAIAAGATDNGAPGIRARYHPNYYGAFVIDPDGHNVKAVCHRPEASS
ncbi:VOC family protein [Lysobacter sp. TY2-98]|uniref:VOC family protein n=1 Tax=Lysobacter sp. TY2-98 TaxID=2290922 RepID=UPI000E1FCB44|nr:VOC family protein [Lysobacter sp. TY2-98]AXK72216.1 VOC family protein [Lysobacter sp. TY2-98]